MTIQTNSLIELLKVFPDDATVRGFEKGLTGKNIDGSEEVVGMNDNLQVPDAAETNRSDPPLSDGPTPEDALEATDPTAAHKLRLVP